MAETINTGSILFKDETLLPDALRFDSEPCATGWRLVKDLDGYELNRIIHDAGWRFFCMASEINRVSSASKDPRPFGGLSSACWRGLRRTNSILCKSREWPQSVSWECLMCVYRPARDISRKVCFCSVIRIFDGWDRARPTGDRAKATPG